MDLTLSTALRTARVLSIYTYPKEERKCGNDMRDTTLLCKP